MAIRNDNLVEVRINRTDPTEATEYKNLVYRVQFQDWYGQDNDREANEQEE